MYENTTDTSVLLLEMVTLTNLAFRGLCIVMYLYNESQRDALFLKFI